MGTNANGRPGPPIEADDEANTSCIREKDNATVAAQGDRSRELARDWGYGPSVEGFLEAVREAVADRS